MRRLAIRLGWREGQLYTVLIAVLVGIVLVSVSVVSVIGHRAPAPVDPIPFECLLTPGPTATSPCSSPDDTGSPAPQGALPRRHQASMSA